MDSSLFDYQGDEDYSDEDWFADMGAFDQQDSGLLDLGDGFYQDPSDGSIYDAVTGEWSVDDAAAPQDPGTYIDQNGDRWTNLGDLGALNVWQNERTGDVVNTQDGSFITATEVSYNYNSGYWFDQPGEQVDGPPAQYDASIGAPHDDPVRTAQQIQSGLQQQAAYAASQAAQAAAEAAAAAAQTPPSPPPPKPAESIFDDPRLPPPKPAVIIPPPPPAPRPPAPNPALPPATANNPLATKPKPAARPPAPKPALGSRAQGSGLIWIGAGALALWFLSARRAAR